MMLAKPEDMLEDSITIAVNRAISIRNRLKVDIWACWDDPTRLFELGYGEHVYPPLTIWLGPNKFQEFFLASINKVDGPEWERFLHPLIGLRAMPWGHAPYEHEQLGRVGKTVFTLIYAIEKAVDLCARHIRILGADMDGPWIDGRTQEECEKINGKRWEWERQTLEACIEAAESERQVFIERI